MSSVNLVLGAIVLTFALTSDASKTITFVTAIITIRGVTWLTQKITATMNKDNGQMIDFAGWCASGIFIVGLLVLAKQGIAPFFDSWHKISSEIAMIGDKVNGFTDWLNSVSIFKK